MRNHITPAALGLAMLLAGNPWQTHNWGGGIAAALLTGLLAHGVQRLAGRFRRPVQCPADVPAVDADRDDA
ncbi:hypothetical protein [Kitasatospora sp. NBC_01302]|uniref:hypothetical protein n=1 Tax=Kitasatospora sp. NBC_01302 TaxID=2903575 RepID=UPI002E1310C2|nr:hypothetical protein OG294_09200 [Kitasatospora sp. NBC_01302]